jgi:hypothetical protein
MFVISFIPVQGIPTEQVDSSDNATCDKKVSDLNLVRDTNYLFAKHNFIIAAYQISLTSPYLCRSPNLLSHPQSLSWVLHFCVLPLGWT